MRSSHAIAVWLFERLRLDVGLAGDLVEERAQGRSAIWYGRQVLIAVWIGIWRAIFDHKLLALRAVATGCAVNSVWLFLWRTFLHLGLPLMPRISTESIACLLIILLTQSVTGWVVARTHRAQAIPVVVVFALWLVSWYLVGSFSDAKRLLVDSIDQARFRPYLTWYLTPISTEVVGLLLGGIVGAHPKRQSSPPINPETA
ncbi:MAG TPA: hypothetical protein VGZ73_21770 [Bryobacteraceae bacterium]|jgi:hypothetical protein|nr:hypothetical protein [Bryobacteraceae bacterium]